MTGPYNGILGMERDIIITKFLNQLPARFEVAEDDEGQLSACLIDIDDKLGRRNRFKPIRITQMHHFFE